MSWSVSINLTAVMSTLSCIKKKGIREMNNNDNCQLCRTRIAIIKKLQVKNLELKKRLERAIETIKRHNKKKGGNTIE